MNKWQTASVLIGLMLDANLADSEDRQDWQNPRMAAQDHLYGDLSNALKKVVGEEFYNYLLFGDWGVRFSPEELEVMYQRAFGDTFRLFLKGLDEEVEVGRAYHDFRGDRMVVTGWERPKHAGSTGRVHTDQGSYYPSVIGAEWREV